MDHWFRGALHHMVTPIMASNGDVGSEAMKRPLPYGGVLHGSSNPSLKIGSRPIHLCESKLNIQWTLLNLTFNKLLKAIFGCSVTIVIRTIYNQNFV